MGIKTKCRPVENEWQNSLGKSLFRSSSFCCENELRGRLGKARRIFRYFNVFGKIDCRQERSSAGRTALFSFPRR